ncbi:hypothetical protein ACFE04_008455 [Oxalis oulophora]
MDHGNMYSSFSNNNNNNAEEEEVSQTFQTSFVQVQDILDQNRLLITQINHNQESKVPDNLNRNVGLIRELNNNIRRVVDLYADLSTNYTTRSSGDTSSSQGDLAATTTTTTTYKSDGKTSQKRVRSR